MIGTDSDLEAFGSALAAATPPGEDFRDSEMLLRRLPIGPGSPFLGKDIRESGIRNTWHCLVAGIEKPDGSLHVPDVTIPFEEGDTIWLVGEKNDMEKILAV